MYIWGHHHIVDICVKVWWQINQDVYRVAFQCWVSSIMLYLHVGSIIHYNYRISWPRRESLLEDSATHCGWWTWCFCLSFLRLCFNNSQKRLTATALGRQDVSASLCTSTTLETAFHKCSHPYLKPGVLIKKHTTGSSANTWQDSRRDGTRIGPQVWQTSVPSYIGLPNTDQNWWHGPWHILIQIHVEWPQLPPNLCWINTQHLNQYLHTSWYIYPQKLTWIAPPMAWGMICLGCPCIWPSLACDTPIKVNLLQQLCFKCIQTLLKHHIY